MFYIGIVRSAETKTGWQVIYFFKVSQNPQGKEILEAIKQKFGCGYIKANSQTDITDKSLAFIVRDLESIRDKVIPFFEGKLFIKKEAFGKFKKVIEIVSEKKHLNKEGMKEILDISYSMNTGKRRFAKEDILRSYQN